MQINIIAALAALGALSLTAGASPAFAGGYWDGGNTAIYGGGYCPPPPPPPCNCPGRSDYGGPQRFDYDQGSMGYDEDEGFAPSSFFDEGYDQDVGSPDAYGADYDSGFVGGGPVVGVNVGFGFGDHRRGFFDNRRRFFDHDRFGERQGFHRFDERQRFFDHDRFNERQRFNVHQRFNVQQHVYVRQHAQQHFMTQPHQMRSYGRSMSGHGRW